MFQRLLMGFFSMLAVVFIIGVYLFGNSPDVVGNWVGNRIGDVASFLGGMGGSKASGTILVKIN